MKMDQKPERMVQKTMNTSLPKSTKLSNIKNANAMSNFLRFYSVVSSGLPELAPPAPGPAVFGPKISSQVKLRVKSDGNSPMPITNPPSWFPNMFDPFTPPKILEPIPWLKFALGSGSDL